MAMQSIPPEDALRQMLEVAGLRPEVSSEMLANLRQSTPDYGSLDDALSARIRTLEHARVLILDVSGRALPLGAAVPDADALESPGALAGQLLALDPCTAGASVREMVLAAEDLQFDAATSKRLADWLIAYALQHRDSQDPGDEAAVWSALRTGASMLHPQDADQLLPLLEPGHPIDTSMVAVKMLGRMFEAHPPEAADAYDGLSVPVAAMVEALLNPFTMDNPDCAARAQLGLYALATMASHRLEPGIRAATGLNGWFARQLVRALVGLRNRWASASPPPSGEVFAPLDRAIGILAARDGQTDARGSA